jgi:hypothetical protein
LLLLTVAKRHKDNDEHVQKLEFDAFLNKPHNTKNLNKCGIIVQDTDTFEKWMPRFFGEMP